MQNRDIKILCYGGGVNSVALLLECTQRGIIFDAILFADPGSEKKASYAYTEQMSEWCKKNGQPEINIVKQVNKEGIFEGLYNDCYNRNNLPAIAYGYKTCSQKFKMYPQDKYLNNWIPAIEAWKANHKVIKFIGYDADESHRVRNDFDEGYENRYLLVEWNWGRLECVKRIIDSGFPLPPKSSCTFCPSMKPWEIVELYETERNAFYRSVAMERNAITTDVVGLGRNYRWWDLIVAYRYLSLIKRYGLPASIPKHIEKLIKKLNRSKPVDYFASVETVIGDLFYNYQPIACECYDGN